MVYPEAETGLVITLAKPGLNCESEVSIISYLDPGFISF
jgi:hypothetical protein